MICLLHVFMVSDTESINGINGNVHSKTERSFSEVSSLPLSRMSSEKLIIPTSSTSQATTRHGNISVIKELYLESVYKKDVAHEFYCPNCNSCIQKVIIRGNEPALNLEQFKCSSCFSFLIPIGNWFFSNSVSEDDESPLEKEIIIVGGRNVDVAGTESTHKFPILKHGTRGHGNISAIKELYLESVYKKDVAHEFYCPNCNSCIQKVIIAPRPEPFRCSSCFSFLIPIGNWFFPNSVSEDDDTPLEKGTESTHKFPILKHGTRGHGNISAIKELYLESVYKKDVAHEFYCPNCNSCIQKAIGSSVIRYQKVKTKNHLEVIIVGGRNIDAAGPEAEPDIEILVDSAEGTTGYELRGSKKLEIVKSIVYGGLIESITSLSVVTSAASADAATSSIIALSLANLIGGIFTIAHNLSDLKSEQPGEVSSLANEQVDRYQELLGRRENFLIHATTALLSFLVFGLVPPAVYGFTFMETDDKNLMLAAVAVASLLCITILAIGKAYIQKPPKNHFKIVLSYLATGIMASGVSYVAGDLAKKLIEKLGWFEPGKAVPLSLAELSSGRLAWASY
ncbi:FE(2+)/MN(2+) TRANSPORTER PCL1 [Salix viminalis]|uniref:FE(2+)/MN(2+) TRANSPORTER PCL1 n=1 Tax=Salix viminalis TaxID=40686 RepID=A0A9Q0YYD8_SALVM|nr:FE(2+)/MN(2+) TRANSPORTER PCL1 [Salix viminalis]